MASYYGQLASWLSERVALKSGEVDPLTGFYRDNAVDFARYVTYTVYVKTVDAPIGYVTFCTRLIGHSNKPWSSKTLSSLPALHYYPKTLRKIIAKTELPGVPVASSPSTALRI